MRKSILVVLLTLLVLSICSLVVFAKERESQNLQKPTQVQKMEPNLGPEAFPQVNLPKPKPVVGTPEDFKKLLNRKGLTPDQVKELNSGKTELMETGVEEREPALCTIANQVAPCCYLHTNPNPFLICWGQIAFATFTNPEDSALGLPRCAYPIYPFMAKQVMFAINVSDPCTVYFQPEIRKVAYVNGCAVPGDSLLTGPVYKLTLASGTNSTYLSLGDSICLNEPWFAVVHFLNTDDFLDTTYCPSAPYNVYISELADNSGRTCQSYWTTSLIPGTWFDVVSNAISFGAVRVRTRGNSKSDNTCPTLEIRWGHKCGDRIRLRLILSLPPA